MVSVFISHSSADKIFARKFANYLSQNNIKVWIDEAEIKVGDSLINKISDGLEDCDYVAAILSKKSVSSKWVQKELELAMTKEIDGKMVIVLPVLIEKCDIPGYLKDKLYANFTDPNNFVQEISKIIQQIKPDVGSESHQRINTTESVLKAISLISKSILDKTQTDDILKSIVDLSAKALDADRCILLLTDLDKKQILKIFNYGYPTEHINSISFAEIENGLSGYCLIKRQPIIVQNSRIDERNVGVSRERAQQFFTGPLIIAPLKTGTEVIGTITLARQAGADSFDDEDLLKLLLFSNQAVIAIDIGSSKNDYNLS